MAAMVETMAYNESETPWHGRGNRVSECVSVDEMLVASGLNWGVEARPLFTTDGSGNPVPVSTRKALVRDSDDKVLSIIGNNWNPLQNKDALEFFREYVEAGDITLETAGSLKGGKVVWGLANLKSGFYVNGSRDAVHGYLLLVSPHEPGQAITIKTTTIRTVCMNTLMMGLSESNQATFRIHHTTEFNHEKAKEAVGLSRERIGLAESEANLLAKMEVSEFDTIRILAKHLNGLMAPTEVDVKSLMNPDNQSKKFKEVLLSIESAPGAVPGTGWGVINGITHWADHVAGRSSDHRLTKSWLGENGRVKNAVYSELLEMAA